MADIITVIRNPDRPLGKRFSITTEGSVHKTSEAAVSRAIARQHQIKNVLDLQRLLRTVASDPSAAITPSAFPLVNGEDFAIFSEQQFENLGISRRDTTITWPVKVTIDKKEFNALGRFKEHTDPSSWLLFDRDQDEHTPECITVNAPGFDAMSEMTWSADSGDSTKDTPAVTDDTTDRDWKELAFNLGQEKQFGIHLQLRRGWLDDGIIVSGLEHLQYRERYSLSRGAAAAIIDYQYNGKGVASSFGPAPGKTSDPSVLNDALGIMKAVLETDRTEPNSVTDPFLVLMVKRVKTAIDRTPIRLLSVRSMQYRLRMEFGYEGRRSSIDFNYDGKQRWTRVEEHGGIGASAGLVNQIRDLLDRVSD